MSRAWVWLLVLAGCGGSTVEAHDAADPRDSARAPDASVDPVDSGLDAAVESDAGAGDAASSDAGRDAAPRLDAGFDRASLRTCERAPDDGLDGSRYAAYSFLPGSSHLQARAFYPFVVLGEVGGAGDLGAITTARRDTLRAAIACGTDAACARDALVWSESDAAMAASEARARLVSLGTFETVLDHLRSSGVCQLFEGADDVMFVERCLGDALLQASVAMARYAGDNDPTVLAANLAALEPDIAVMPFWGPITQAAEATLAASHRPEPTRYEPLATTENGPTIARLSTIDWSAYPFVAIVVPGQGPTDPDTALHPQGRMRCEVGAERYFAGLAPVILVSGGHVHPDRTRYSEAIEMRRHLVEVLGVPADAVLVDPYARHTTTNLRNATRILVRAGVPGDRPVLVTTDFLQAAYIRSVAFDVRNDDELGYRAYHHLQTLSSLDSCFFMVAESLQVDARDPLDP